MTALTPKMREALLEVLVDIFSAGCRLDQCLAEGGEEFDNPAGPLGNALYSAATKVDQAQDILLDACGIEIDEVHNMYLVAQKDR